METTGTKTKATKKRKFVKVPFECDEITLKHIDEVADLAEVTRSQAISVILTLFIREQDKK